jgi:hypothetical protein
VDLADPTRTWPVPVALVTSTARVTEVAEDGMPCVPPMRTVIDRPLLSARLGAPCPTAVSATVIAETGWMVARPVAAAVASVAGRVATTETSGAVTSEAETARAAVFVRTGVAATRWCRVGGTSGAPLEVRIW